MVRQRRPASAKLWLFQQRARVSSQFCKTCPLGLGFPDIKGEQARSRILLILKGGRLAHVLFYLGARSSSSPKSSAIAASLCAGALPGARSGSSPCSSPCSSFVALGTRSLACRRCLGSRRVCSFLLPCVHGRCLLRQQCRGFRTCLSRSALRVHQRLLRSRRLRALELSLRVHERLLRSRRLRVLGLWLGLAMGLLCARRRPCRPGLLAPRLRRLLSRSDSPTGLRGGHIRLWDVLRPPGGRYPSCVQEGLGSGLCLLRVLASRGREGCAHFSFRVLLFIASDVLFWVLGASGAAGGHGP